MKLSPETRHNLRHHPDADIKDTEAQETILALLDALETAEKERDALAKRINPDGAPVDVAALCLEIDEATDEIDRVKAESLRVVKVGEARHPEKGAYHCLYENGGVLAIHYGENEMFFLSDNPGFVKLSKHADAFTPVRLERWEPAP